MITMLKLHFYFSRKFLLLMIILVVGSIAVLHYFFEPFSLSFFAFIFFLQMGTVCISFYMENNFIQLLRTMPITTKHFVTSTYVYAMIILSAIGIPLLIYQFYQYHVTGDEYNPYLYLGLFFVCLVDIGMQLRRYFSNPVQNSRPFDLPNIIFLLLVLFLPHALILALFSALFSIEIGGFIIPTLSLWIYYKLYLSSITKFEQAEL